MTVDSFSQEIAARTVWMEARGETQEGRVAIAFVLHNRAGDSHTLAEVCLAPFQFSCWNTSDPNRKAMAKLPYDDEMLWLCRRAVLSVANSNDPTGGATHYVNLAVANPDWTAGATLTATIGHHTFYRDVA